MLGFQDFAIIAGYALAALSFVFCLIYGIANWNRGLIEKGGDYKEEIRWEKEEIELIEKLP
jgi:hypothetical protein